MPMTGEAKEAYSALMARSKEMFVLGSANSILYWDMETKMPPAAQAMRGEQLSALELIVHKKMTDPENDVLLKRCEAELDSFDDLQKRNLHLLRKSYDESSKIPDKLVAETAMHQSKCNMVWKKAKAARDFKMFRDDLAKMIALREQAADILMKVKGTKPPYDALLDQFEPNMTAERIDEVFSELRQGLIRLIGKVESCDFKPDMSPMSR